MDLLSLFVGILEAHTRSPTYKPYVGEKRTRKEGLEPIIEKGPKKTVYVQKPELASGERFKPNILPNEDDKYISAEDVQTAAVSPLGEEFIRKKITA